ncbi:ribosomal protein L11 (nucleomorph) [Bigelowiella natans]|uniref:Ribosomal protein L11 n=1 Tax=Bigelowiella natans TaxID=227086 RepID=Q3LWF5_BIGNA|nr:ribosomal protein L11 [Bigelowiella natans]ABA27210.1 ribosomal protein L11 [Bigelowiella natans]
MKQIFLNKLILSIDVGSSGSNLYKSSKLLKKISLQFPSFGMAKRTIKTFSIRRGEYISCFCSLSKKKGILFLYKMLKLKTFTINESNFSLTSTFGIGISDHLELGYNFDQKIGIHGINIIGDLSRRGYRIKLKKEQDPK